MSDTWIIIASVALVAVGIAGLMASRKPKSEPPKPDKAPEKPPQPTTAHDSAETSKLVPMHVYYGSQTGTAEGFSKQISNDAKRHGFKATVVDLENFDVDTFVGTAGNDSASGHPHVAVFIMATYGEGDPTDNAVAFTKWLKVKCVLVNFPLGFSVGVVFYVPSFLGAFPSCRTQATRLICCMV